MNHEPIMIATPRCPMVRVATANTQRDGTGTLGTLVLAGPEGAYYLGFRWQAEAITTTGFIRLFVQKAGTGNNELLYEGVVPAVTPVAGVTPAISGVWMPEGGITLGAGDIAKVGVEKSEPFSGWLLAGGDYD